MNYAALAKWIETVAKREQLGPPWSNGSPKGMGALLDIATEPSLIRAIYSVGRQRDWFTRSTFITSFLEYLQDNGHVRLSVEIELCSRQLWCSGGDTVDEPVKA